MALTKNEVLNEIGRDRIFILQERIGEYLSSSRDTKAVGRRPFDKMATLLAYLGPPEHRAVDTQFLVIIITS